MKYFTTEWYHDMERSTLAQGLRADARAAAPDEAFYLEQYEKWVAAELDYERRAAALTFEDCFPAPVKADMKYLPDDEIAAIKAEYEDNLEEYRRLYAARPPYDEARLRRELDGALEEDTKRFVRLLPEELLREVADPRLLALEVASPAVKRSIAEYAGACESRVEETLERYDHAYRMIADRLPPPLTSEHFDLHDARIVSAVRDGDCLTITIDPEGSYSKLTSITLTGVSAVSGDPTDAFWLYDEVALDGEGYTLGVLLARGDGEPFAFECTFTGITAESSLSGQKRPV